MTKNAEWVHRLIKNQQLQQIGHIVFRKCELLIINIFCICIEHQKLISEFGTVPHDPETTGESPLLIF